MVPASPTSTQPDPTHKPVLSALFDLSFSSFISLELVRHIYLAAIMIAVVAAITAVLIAFSFEFWIGILSLFITPFFFLLFVMCCRISLEIILALFQLTVYSREIAENTSILGRRDPLAGGPPH